MKSKQVNEAQLEAVATHAELARLTDLQVQTMGGSLVVMLQGLGNTIEQWNGHQGFWQSENVGEKLMLMTTELAEAMEAYRTDAASDKIPEFSGVEEELADTFIRMLDFASHFRLRLGEAIVAKLRYNLSRPYKHGKKC